ncbi:4189a031-5167-46aa-a407-c00ca31d2241 [Sclerotinia trifoliorum]|uniref:4189a031-5167-46aa-a407-c00ca31d2241 n=1 Tax=Sclerotinia trifoliorum TaxID=28548 RepID=A0A8H2ZLZ9_9HELO|nr:4189a031-5167-46aa-a407-c00ca31d2241 [Sclerotinia trifoliorum]
MQFSKISSATAALLISLISASPIALTYDAIHPSGSVHIRPTGSIEHSFRIRPTGSFNPKEPIPTCTDEEIPKFTINPTGGKTEPHHYRPSGTGVRSHEGPRPTGYASKSYENSHSKPSGHVSQRAIESDDAESSTVSNWGPKHTGNAFHKHESGHAKPTGSGKKENAHPSGTGVYKDENPRQSGHAKPTETGDRKIRENGHAKASGTGGREGEFGHAKPTGTRGKDHTQAHESGHAKPTGTGAEHGHAQPTGVHSHVPEFTGAHKSKSDFKTETETDTMILGSKASAVIGAGPEVTGRSLF